MNAWFNWVITTSDKATAQRSFSIARSTAVLKFGIPKGNNTTGTLSSPVTRSPLQIDLSLSYSFS